MISKQGRVVFHNKMYIIYLKIKKKKNWYRLKPYLTKTGTEILILYFQEPKVNRN